MARNKYDVDESLETKFDIHQLLRLLKYVGPYRGKLILTIVLMLFSSALTMVIPLFVKEVMDVCIPNKDMNQIIRISGYTLLIIIIVCWILKIKIKLTNEIGQGVIHSLRSELFEQLQRLPFSYYDSRPHGNTSSLSQLC